MTSTYDKVVTGKLRLKGQALDVKGGIKKKRKHQFLQVSSTGGDVMKQFENDEHYDIPKVDPG